jgi:hypothetical protein
MEPADPPNKYRQRESSVVYKITRIIKKLLMLLKAFNKRPVCMKSGSFVAPIKSKNKR